MATSLTPLLRSLATPDSLLEAWSRVRRGGKAPGIDGVTLQGFERRLDAEIARLVREVRSGDYRPWPARRVRIPKSDGSDRLIGVQAVRDRVVQRALLGRVQPRVEPELEPCAYAYRPGRSVESALAAIGAYHREGHAWAARSDVRLCFDSLDRTRLMGALGRFMPERDALALVQSWLSAGAVDQDALVEPGIGVPQGDVLSPLLCNLYLDAFDEAVNRPAHPLVRYADDFVILGKTEHDARRGMERAARALADIGLQINEKKTAVVPFIQGFEYLGAAIVGSLIMPLHRVERPGYSPVFRFGYGPAPRPQSAASRGRRAPIITERRLASQMIELLRLQRRGVPLPAMAAAMLQAWTDAGRISEPRRPPEPEGWQSVYLIKPQCGSREGRAGRSATEVAPSNSAKSAFANCPRESQRA